jgi:uncharacterized protein (DUF983 family)
MLEFGGNTAQATLIRKPPATPGARSSAACWGVARTVVKASFSASYLKPVDACPACGEEMLHHRADDFPAYLAIFIVGHIVVAGFMATDTWLVLESWQHLMIWIPITVILTLAMLPSIKGAVIGLQWALRMHGFGGESEEPMLAAPAHEDVR